MSEIMRDSAIKLFGKTITLSDASLSEHRHSSTSDSLDTKDEHESADPTETLTEATSSDVDDESHTSETPKPDEGSNDSNTPALKKPDKIIPCPRCSSTATKFCYYNNYNVNQPRYFCKNCQRYWTSGGTMRNVPVGSGRRKTKSAAAPGPHHIVVSPSGALQPGFFIGPDSGFFYPYWTAVPAAPQPSLGKRSREEEEEESIVTAVSNLETERSMWVPKTLRIHDPSEAAKSSIWSTLGRIKNEKTGLFRAFGTKGDGVVDSSAMVRQANPAAMSRSLNFQEGA